MTARAALSASAVGVDKPKVHTRHWAAVPLLLSLGGCGGVGPTGCDGFADRKLAIAVEEYRPCAREILDALDEMEPALRAIVKNTATADQRNAARHAYRQLQTRILRTGLEDDYRSMRPGTVLIKWSNGPMSAFNRAAYTALVQYMSVLSYPSADNFAQGVRAHEEAKRWYRAMH